MPVSAGRPQADKSATARASASTSEAVAAEAADPGIAAAGPGIAAAGLAGVMVGSTSSGPLVLRNWRGVCRCVQDCAYFGDGRQASLAGLGVDLPVGGQVNEPRLLDPHRGQVSLVSSGLSSGVGRLLSWVVPAAGGWSCCSGSAVLDGCVSGSCFHGVSLCVLLSGFAWVCLLITIMNGGCDI